MWRDLIRTIDGVLRGRFTRRETLSSGRIDVPAVPIALASILLGCAYGCFMGLFALFTPGRPHHAIDQFLATVVKVPLLFLLTLVVTFPSLYVVSALFDSRLEFRATLRLLVIAILVDLALLASFGPVTGFFTLSTTSYPFMVILNVVLFGVSGLVGLGFLRRALDGVFGRGAPPSSNDETSNSALENPPEDAPSNQGPQPASRIFTIWILIYAVVGAQMGWILRPFIGNPNLPFQFFRPRGSNFFEAVMAALHQLTR